MYPRALFDRLVSESEDSRTIDLDHFADVVAPFDLGHDELDALLADLEAAGRSVDKSPSVALGRELAQVLPAIRAFTAREGRRPTIEEVARENGWTPAMVRRALAFGRILGR